MSKEQDKTFFVTFMVVLGGLFAFTFFIIFAARALQGEPELTPAQIAKIEERLRPAGAVNTDPNAAAALPADPAATGGAESGPKSGEQVVAQACGACHNGAIPNAPKIGDKAAWSARGNLGALVASAIKGKGAMPPKGGNPSLTDAEIEAAIKHMSGL